MDQERHVPTSACGARSLEEGIAPEDEEIAAEARLELADRPRDVSRHQHGVLP